MLAEAKTRQGGVDIFIVRIFIVLILFLFPVESAR